eukprot:1950381-Prymnesium_polylepis.1
MQLLQQPVARQRRREEGRALVADAVVLQQQRAQRVAVAQRVAERLRALRADPVVRRTHDRQVAQRARRLEAPFAAVALHGVRGDGGDGAGEVGGHVGERAGGDGAGEQGGARVAQPVARHVELRQRGAQRQHLQQRLQQLTKTVAREVEVRERARGAAERGERVDGLRGVGGAAQRVVRQPQLPQLRKVLLQHQQQRRHLPELVWPHHAGARPAQLQVGERSAEVGAAQHVSRERGREAGAQPARPQVHLGHRLRLEERQHLLCALVAERAVAVQVELDGCRQVARQHGAGARAQAQVTQPDRRVCCRRALVLRLHLRLEPVHGRAARVELAVAASAHVQCRRQRIDANGSGWCRHASETLPQLPVETAMQVRPRGPSYRGAF